MERALNVANEKIRHVEEAETHALAEVKDYYNVLMEAIRARMNDLGWWSSLRHHGAVLIFLCQSELPAECHHSGLSTPLYNFPWYR